MVNNRTWNPQRPAVPIDKQGNWMNYPYYDFSHWEEIFAPFHAVMTVDRMYSGRSAKGVILRDERGREYPMFVADLIEVIKKSEVSQGRINSLWRPVKRGQNYGITPTTSTTF